jgi:Ran GTPase-activating protein (RanGAP) involved in mRNA processing and transport
LTLDLSEGGYTDEDMKVVVEHMMVHKRCNALLLHHNQITEKGVLQLAEALKNNISLKKLNLGYNNIGDRGVEYIVKPMLMSNNTLAKLHLQSNSITEKGADHLAKMLRINTAMRHLGLDYNNIGDRGVKLLSLALSSTGVEINHASNFEVHGNDYFL